MKKFFIILFIIFLQPVVGQQPKITLKDLLKIDSKESFEKLVLENNFERLSNAGTDFEDQIMFGLDVTKDSDGNNQAPYFATVFSDFSYWSVSDVNYARHNSFYKKMIKKIKKKCHYEGVLSNDYLSVMTYSCPNASLKGHIAFSISEGSGVVNYYVD